MPPESSEELTFAIGNGEKREEEKKWVYKTCMKIFFDLLLWSDLRGVGQREKSLYLKAGRIVLHLTSGSHARPSVLYFHSV